MEKGFWSARWDEGQLGFHQKASHPALERHWGEFLSWAGRASSPSSALVPLCGKSPDIAWLAERCERVVGVEFVERAVRDYFSELGVVPQVAAAPTAYAHGNTRLVVSDYFALAREQLGALDVAYDRAALVAVQPDRRVDYLVQTGRLLEPKGALFCIGFEHDGGSGPPFSVDDLPSLFERSQERGVRYRFEAVETRDILDEEPRFRARGFTYLRELVWFAQRVD